MNNKGIFDPEGININPLNNLPYSDEYKALAKMWSNLPAYNKRTEIVDDIKNNDIILIKSETGSGKSVLIPKFTIHTLDYKGLTVMTLPKKIITQNTAEFAAKTLDTPIGEYVGYQYRGEQVKSSKTILLFSTDGSIISMIKQDPLLMDIDILIIDEAHERKTQIDLLLYLIKTAISERKQQNLKPLKLIIMSATIDEKLFENYFKEFKFKFLFLSGETNYEIKSFFLEDSILKERNKYVEQGKERIEKIIKDINNGKSEEGDILFFVTSIAECKKITEELEEKFSDSFVMALYSGYPQELKPYVSNPLEYKHLNSNYKRRIFIATNVAESSITLDGICYVVDSGLEINVYYDPKKQVNIMEKQLVTKAQMRQRKGRAGRTKEGYCYHLYTKEEMENTKDFPEPEIKTIDLKNICLSFMQIESNILKKDASTEEVKHVFQKLIQPPEDKYVEDGFKFADKHGLIENNVLTTLGKLIVDTKMDVFESLTLLYAYQYSREIFNKIFLIICILGRMKSGIEDFFFKDIEDKKIEKTIKKIDSHHSEFILLYELFQIIKEDKENKIYNIKLYQEIKKLYEKNKNKTYDVFAKHNYKMEVKEHKSEWNTIIHAFHYGFGSNQAKRKDNKFYFNGLPCDFDSYIDTDKLDKIIFYSNIYMHGKLKLGIISK